MKINSNTIKLEKESYEKLENIIKKIASDNKIDNVEDIEIKLSKENGIIKFAIIDDWADNENISQESEKDDAGYNGYTNWETWNVPLWVFNDEPTYRELNRYPGTYTPDKAEEFVRNRWPNGTPDMGSNEDYEKVNWQEIADAFNEE